MLLSSRLMYVTGTKICYFPQASAVSQGQKHVTFLKPHSCHRDKNMLLPSRLNRVTDGPAA
jgi:hypothetical protein